MSCKLGALKLQFTFGSTICLMIQIREAFQSNPNTITGKDTTVHNNKRLQHAWKYHYNNPIVKLSTYSAILFTFKPIDIHIDLVTKSHYRFTVSPLHFSCELLIIPQKSWDFSDEFSKLPTATTSL